MKNTMNGGYQMLDLSGIIESVSTSTEGVVPGAGDACAQKDKPILVRLTKTVTAWFTWTGSKYVCADIGSEFTMDGDTITYVYSGGGGGGGGVEIKDLTATYNPLTFDWDLDDDVDEDAVYRLTIRDPDGDYTLPTKPITIVPGTEVHIYAGRQGTTGIYSATLTTSGFSLSLEVQIQS